MRARFSLVAASAVLTLLTVLAACSSGGGTAARRADCALRPGDSTFAVSGPVYRECAVSRVARPLPNRLSPTFTPSRPASNSCYSAEFEFVVSPEGSPEPSSARVVQTNDPAYATSVLAILPLWRFVPAERDGVPVRQIVTQRSIMQVQVVAAPAGTVPRPPSRVRPTC